MKKAKMMKKYANLIATTGINCNQKQDVVIEAPVETYSFVRYLVMELYACKARSVEVVWSDSIITKQNIMHVAPGRLDIIPEWQVDRAKYFVDKNYSRIVIVGEDPSAFKMVNPERLTRRNKAMVETFQPLKKKYHNNELAWCIAAVPTTLWAKRVFPTLSPTQAEIKLWKCIYETCRITEYEDPIELWDKHIEELSKHADILNKYAFKSLHYKNSKGTDLTIGLAKNHIWCSAQAIQGFNGKPFVPNLPTEEVFTMPDNQEINGVVYSTKPLSYNGILIDEFKVEFKNGRVVNFSAKEGEEKLGEIIHFDQGSASLGEVALVPYNSPISLQNVVYQETLFDENASCHLAFGQSFLENLKEGEKLDEFGLERAHANQSKMHVDFMVGSKDLSIDGILEDGTIVPVFRDGNFVF